MSEYSEDALVEQSAIDVFVKDLKIEHLNCYEEKFPETLGRDAKSDVVIVKKLSAAIEKLNPGLSEDAKKDAIAQLLQDRSRLSMVKANQEVYKLLRDGVKVKTKNKQGNYEYKTVKIIDFSNPKNNDFFLASQFWVTGEVYTRRPDLILFVNGLPLVVVELKARGVDVKRAFDDNITDYKETIPQLFWYNAFILISNGRDAKIGSITSGYEHFSEWKRVEKEKEVGIVSLDRIIKGTCEPNKLIDLFESFILFSTIEGNQVKIVAKNHQFLGVNNAVQAFANRKKNKGRLGVFWHTQGSGKSYSMIFFTQKVLRKFEGNFTFLVVTDRTELDTQIYRNFQNSGVVTEEKVQAESGEHLKQLLREDHRLVFTLIHKFGTDKGVAYPKLSDRDDIIIITDEAHRTQYDILALNMRNALPNAAFLGFTGTPLMDKGEEKTKETFGDYISIYNFRASIEDQATVPLYYENRVPEMQLINPDLNEDIYNTVEEAELDEGQEEKLAKEFAREYHIITREDRLNAIAEDIANHFINRGYGGKAMVVSIDKFTTVKMYDKVQYYFQKNIDKLKAKHDKAKYEYKVLKDKIASLKKIDMAVVISQEQNEVKKFKEKGLDISKHRKRMVNEDLATLFKKPESDFQIVFVCNMWMTGFDVPSLSTIYLDKPMKNHTLMQAIARANRVFHDKSAGFIVDYINVFRNLKKALAIYAAPSAGGEVDMPIQSKDKLVAALKDYIKELNKYLKEQGIKHDKIIETRGLEKNKLLDEALSALVINDNVKKNFLQKAGIAIKTFSAILPHKDASEFSAYIALYQDLVKEIRSLDPEVDITAVMQEIQTVLDKSIAHKGYVIKESAKTQTIDLSKIDFEALKKQFEKKKNNADIERLKNILTFKLKEMIRRNSMRIDYQERFQALIDDYNSGSLNQERFFDELVKFSNSLEEEDRRAVVEGLTEEELALFDKLKKPKLTEKETQQIKNVAKTLLHKLQPAKLVIDWRKKQQTRAAVKLEIEKELDKGLPASYTPEDFQTKVEAVFQHFFDNYIGDGQTVFEQKIYSS
jgi:type I restriction enzyme R subunit